MDPPSRRHGQERSRKRSGSPRSRDNHPDVKRHRSRSPYHHSHHHHRHSKPSPNIRLPLGARPLHKRDIETHTALLAEYLDVQKGKDIDELGADEVKGRWKSFLGKWNRGELAEGWYDRETKEKVDARYGSRTSLERVKPGDTLEDTEQASEDEDDGYGPALPDTARRPAGPAAPNLQELQHRRELAGEDREARVADIRYERKLDRNSQKERLEELVPRAEPGSHERQLEKKRETTAVNRAFKDAKEGGGVEEVGDKELMGDDGVDTYKAQMKTNERQKNEREIRKEEMLRARAEEREERLAEHRKKEEKTLDMLRSLAKQRYG